MQGHGDLGFSYNIPHTSHHDYVYVKCQKRHAVHHMVAPNPWHAVLRLTHAVSHLLSIEDRR